MNDDIPTDLVDLSNVSLADLRRAGPEVAEQVGQAVGQVTKARRNLGSSGPPGRVD